MKKIKCPCCGYFTQLVEDDAKPPFELFEICEVCFWQYDAAAHDKPNMRSGANGISLNEAKENYGQFGICAKEHIGKGLVREPIDEELS
jgi:rubredoxin